MAGVGLLLKVEAGGGGGIRGGVGVQVPRGCLQGGGGGGAIFFFRGRSPHQVYYLYSIGHTPRGSCNRTLLRRVLRRFFQGSAS